MAGSLVGIAIDDAGTNKNLAAIEERAGSQLPAWQTIGEIVVDSVLRDFEEHRAPDGTPWHEVSPAYAAWKEAQGRDPENILILHRILMASIHWEATDHDVSIGSPVIYAAIHQLGGEIHVAGIIILMPERPFLGVRDEDWDRISWALANYVINGSAN